MIFDHKGINNEIVSNEIGIAEDLIVTPGEANSDGERVDVTLHDHPLNLNPDSKWQTYFKDNEVLLQIDKDVRYVFDHMM